MRHFYHTLLAELDKGQRPVLATVLATKGSAPQVPGASALFSERGLLSGTLGGGILEGDATRRALEFGKKGISQAYRFDLKADFSSPEGAICGGSATLLLDAEPARNLEAFRNLEKSLTKGNPGILVTHITGKEEVKIDRIWAEMGKAGEMQGAGKSGIPDDLNEIASELEDSMRVGECRYLKKSPARAIFLEPVNPPPKLIIAGAGHIGRALTHMANLLEFEVTVVDDRPEYANPENLPDADHIIAAPIGKALRKLPVGRDTYVVIVTRGHRDDSDALRACIDWDVPYIGMIGSRKKVRTMRENFLSEGWATASRFDRVHAPIGLEIGSKTVQEIAVSICAELIQVRNLERTSSGTGGLPKARHIAALILAAGESRRMGKPKLLLPYGDRSIIETVIASASRSVTDKPIVVLGADREKIEKRIADAPAIAVFNREYKKGMLSSVQAGLRALTESTQAVMVLLADQPMIGSGIMKRMIDAFRESGSGILVATYRGKRGHPILIGSEYFREVLDFPAGSSLRELLDRHPEEIVEVETGSPEILRDIDTENDYHNELKHQHNYD